VRAFWRRLVVLLRMGAPPRLTLRLPVWMVRLSAREFAFQWTAILLALLGVLVLEGEPSGVVGSAVLAVIAALTLVELRFAFLAWRSAAAVREALADFPPEPEQLRFPRSHLLLPALMLRSRGSASSAGSSITASRGAGCGSTSTARPSRRKSRGRR
jgi:hypothetical protein